MSDTPVTYVRKEMLGQKAPPTSEVGPVRWVRENLFSSPMNAFLTILSLYAIYVVVSHVGPWLLNGIWDAESLTECREIIAATGDGHHSAACFGVISARWHQLVFGYYPSELYWRPILALVVFLVGISPVMFPSLPRKLYIVTLAAPLLCFWLLWGGSIWFPVSIALGFGVGVVAHKLLDENVSALAAIIGAIVLPLLFWLYLAGPIASGLDSVIPLGIEFVPSRSFGGFMLSIVIGLSAIVISLPLGILLALARRSDLFIIKTCAVVFIEVIRGIPLIVWLFTAQLLLNYFLPPGSSFDLTLRVIIMVTLFASAYIAEVIRGGLAALPKGQYEGADSLGLNYWQSMQLIILPQALKISIPGIVNTFIGLFKDTTLVVFIGLFDPLGIASAIRATTEWNGIYWELFLFIGIMFFISCFSMGRYSLYLEKKLQREHR
ncbi:L-glutamine ABC transporter membrane protein /L-glutamate ABC transporter membrane protein /L-aspartate ABC transporter membrane protein /L-asparagine ABC transporter membrane protein [Yoonia tamlensis]|uniref:L-glutamine ABC transporter membrane protein /L-glutamate ABC transporter membrane protein /L-aspartate ABC transporter membrane protein /L-asparagine ABC transporter membrane protein n=1 Tax=Yoonia tamlensis TaxID=390270 RepID=A0A1I6FNL7_9RHOB|nr:amino acid ABC transporter permease [Yoonia tamlensis]SFR31454.1 L-glutamine ABC transporter membrane protein /L-glutamate ABC transporter membrane protein /L-aspartate ABC transporter membrane protein /L-asparagine ABC transporter membrane protein [Yoonia tamlensis]